MRLGPMLQNFYLLHSSDAQSSVVGKEMKALSAQVVSCCVYDKLHVCKVMQHKCHGNIPYFFDFWADLFVHLVLLKSSMTYAIYVHLEAIT